GGSDKGRQGEGPDIGGISIDTRTLQPGDLVIALSGDPCPRFHTSIENPRDGHEFVPMAVEGGAAAIMASRAVDTDIPVLRVPDTLEGLWDLGRAGRRRMQGKVAAITGSSGKTTARHWLQSAMACQGRTHGSRGSLNNHWGVPLSLARMPADSEFGIFEIGMNHPGEIAPLAELAAPDVAVVLNVLPAHLGHFDSLEGIRREKLSISAGLKKDGVLIVPDDLPCDEVPCRKRTFGFGAGADVRGQAQYGAEKIEVRVSIEGRDYEFTLAGNGEHRVLTALAVIAAGDALGGSVEGVCTHLGEITTPRGRGEMVTVGNITMIDDRDNAKPVSIRCALE
ncbi:MAG: UDP-N-acetylmuramoyl-tripeptide--D-alanyl-D-alanine ligase, partial [Pseudomonadales bacterium]|nr:UDP-N-acetylmuramoyl-tripeptide--D-alanyl-D-alanine ligase [Pseudomonadales bacterium]